MQMRRTAGIFGSREHVELWKSRGEKKQVILPRDSQFCLTLVFFCLGDMQITESHLKCGKIN